MSIFTEQNGSIFHCKESKRVIGFHLGKNNMIEKSYLGQIKCYLPNWMFHMLLCILIVYFSSLLFIVNTLTANILLSHSTTHERRNLCIKLKRVLKSLIVNKRQHHGILQSNETPLQLHDYIFCWYIPLITVWKEHLLPIRFQFCFNTFMAINFILTFKKSIFCFPIDLISGTLLMKSKCNMTFVK